MKPTELKPRQGKVLRFVVSRTKQGQSVKPDDCVVETTWSELPKTRMQAVAALNALRKLGLLTKDKQGYTATAAGGELIMAANKQGLWQTAPPPNITNPKRRSAA